MAPDLDPERTDSDDLQVEELLEQRHYDDDLPAWDEEARYL